MPVILPAPPAPPVVLADYQFLYSGLLWGKGTKYRVNAIDGLRSLPLLRVSDYARLKHHGVFSGIDVLEGRILSITMHVIGDDVDDLDTLLENLEAATVPLLTGSLPMLVKLPHQTQRRLYARVRKRALPLDPTYNRGWAKADFEFFCSDPRIYDDTLTTTVIATSGNITNVGNFESRPLVEVAPSATAVGISNLADGSALVLQNTTLGVIPSPTIIDLLNRTVIDGNTGANRFDLVAPTSIWPALIPGPNPIFVSGGSTSWIWRSAWI